MWNRGHWSDWDYITQTGLRLKTHRHRDRGREMAPVAQNRPEDRRGHEDHSSSNRMRKLLVEKGRRDRINHSLEQLRALLDPGQTASRLEKVHVLERAVGLLRQRALVRAAPSYSQGFSQCLQETLRHLSLHAALRPEQREDIKRFYVLQRAALHSHMTREQSGRSHVTTAGKWMAAQDHVSLWRPW